MYNLYSDVRKFLIYSLTKTVCIENKTAKKKKLLLLLGKKGRKNGNVAESTCGLSILNIHTQTHTLTSQNTNKMNKMLGPPFIILSVHFFDENSQQKSTEIES